MSQFEVKDLIDMIVALNGAHMKDYILQKEEYHFIDGSLIEKVVTHNSTIHNSNLYRQEKLNMNICIRNYLRALVEKIQNNHHYW